MINLGIGALILAIWIITLFLGKDIGLSMLLFTAPFVYFFIHLLEKNNKIKNSKSKILLIPITYFIYDNTFFNNWNLLIIPILIVFLILGLIGEKLEINLDTIGTLLGVFLTPISYIGESIKKLVEAIAGKLSIKTNDKTKKIFKAILITVPIVLVIIILLSSADEIFANIFKSIFAIIFHMLWTINISKIICMLIAFLYFMGLFYYICIKYEVIQKIEENSSQRYDNFTIKTILISLNVIYLVFCCIQIKSLFIRNTTLNYAHYARQGFFQLMVVSLINLLVILIAKKRENKEEEKSNKYINYMSLLMIFFTFIIVISAAIRMHFYESAYGYTLLRLLVYCILLTECILFIPTILYILDKKINLPKCYFTIIIITYVCMIFANFDNIIDSKNVNRYIETGKIDMYYLKHEMGTDAVRQIFRILEASSTDTEEIKIEARKYLQDVYKRINEEKFDFRNFNISKLLAKNLIGNELELNDN